MSNPDRVKSRTLMAYCADRYHEGAPRVVVQQELEQHFRLSPDAASIAAELGQDKKNWPFGCTASLEAEACNPTAGGLRASAGAPARRLWLRIPLLSLGILCFIAAAGNHLLHEEAAVKQELVIGSVLTAGFFILKPRRQKPSRSTAG